MIRVTRVAAPLAGRFVLSSQTSVSRPNAPQAGPLNGFAVEKYRSMGGPPMCPIHDTGGPPVPLK